MQLQGSLACTDWGVFAPDSVNLNEHASFITDYVTFCVDSTIPMQTVTVYPNSKPWITSDIKTRLRKNKSHTALRTYTQLKMHTDSYKQKSRKQNKGIVKRRCNSLPSTQSI